MCAGSAARAAQARHHPDRHPAQDHLGLHGYEGESSLHIDAFGFHVALSGKVVATGSWRNDDAGANSGSAYFTTFKDF